MKLYLGNISYQSNENDIYDLLRVFGQVEFVKLITDKETGESKGYAFCKMSNNSEAEVVLKELNNQLFMGRKLIVNNAIEQKKKPGKTSYIHKRKKKALLDIGKHYYQQSLS